MSLNPPLVSAAKALRQAANDCEDLQAIFDEDNRIHILLASNFVGLAGLASTIGAVLDNSSTIRTTTRPPAGPATGQYL